MTNPRNWPFNQKNYARDTGNEQTVPLGAGANFIGQFTEVDQLHGIVISYITGSQPALMRLAWSIDGISSSGLPADYTTLSVTFNSELSVWICTAVIDPPLRPFYRVETVNGATPQGFVFSTITVLGASFPGVFQNIDAPYHTYFPALVTRSVQAAGTPDLGFTNLPAGGVVANNSTATALGANATYIGAWVNTEQYVALAVTVNADQPSATNGLQIQFSDNGSAVRRTLPFTYTAANSGRGFQVPAETRFARVLYTNGPIAQTTFLLQTKLATTALQVPEVALDAVIVDSVTAALTRSILTGKRPDSTYGNVSVSAANQVEVHNDGFAFHHRNAAGTTTLKTGPGVLRGVTLNNTSAASTLTLYDNTAGSGAVIAALNIGAAGTPLPAAIRYDAKFATGLTVVQTGTDDFSVTYE